MSSGLLPPRPAPMARPPVVPDSSGRRPWPHRHRRLALVFRRPATAPPAPVLRPAAGAPVKVSVHFAVTLALVERLRTIVEHSSPGVDDRSAKAARAGRGPAGQPGRRWRRAGPPAWGWPTGSRELEPRVAPDRTTTRLVAVPPAIAWRLVRRGNRWNPAAGGQSAAAAEWSRPPTVDWAGPAPEFSRSIRPTSAVLAGSAATSSPLVAWSARDDGRPRWAGSPRGVVTPTGRPDVVSAEPWGPRSRRPIVGGAVAGPPTAVGPRPRPISSTPMVPAAGVGPHAGGLRRWSTPPAPGGGPGPIRLDLAAGGSPQVPAGLWFRRSGGGDPGSGRPPVERVHRRPPSSGPQPAPGRSSSGPGTTTPPASPPIDLDRLDRDLWKRFEKRIRVEQERRGRR
jgi:hypothetical protein